MATILLATLYAEICLAEEFGNKNGINIGQVEIQSVSNNIGQQGSHVYGSIKGGTTLYLKVKNHSMDPIKNKVLVGPYPCIVHEKGVSTNYIQCITTPQTEADRYEKLDIELHVHEKVQSICTADKEICQFSYSRSNTPFLRQITPIAGTPTEQIALNGIWRVDSTKEIKKIKIGDDICSRQILKNEIGDDELNLNDDERIFGHTKQNINCQISKVQAAGLYNTSFETPNGEIYQDPQTTHLTIDGKTEYQFAIIPEINYLNSNTGGESGNRLIIEGTGFGDLKKNVQAKIDNLNCSIKQIQNNKITCDLEQGTTVQPSDNQFIKGQGAKITEYRLGKFTDKQGVTHEGLGTILDVKKFRQAVLDSSIDNIRIFKDGLIGSWSSIFGEYGQSGVHVRGYFKAPRTGKYNFWISASQYAEVFFNPTPKNTTVDYEQDKILYLCDKRDQRDYFYPFGDKLECNGLKRVEISQDLQEGELYWVELFVLKVNFQGHFTLSVDTPHDNSGIAWPNSLDKMEKVRILPNTKKEKWSLKMFNSNDDYEFSYEYINPSTRKLEYNKNIGPKTWQNWDGQTFIENLDKIYMILFDPELVEEHNLDVNGNRCTDCTAQGREIIFQFKNKRPNEGKFSKIIQCNQSQSTCIIQKLQSPSQGISGTFKLQLEWLSKGQTRQEYLQISQYFPNGSSKWTRDIPIDITSHKLKEGLIKLDSQFYDVQVFDTGRPEDGKSFYFDWRRDSFKGQAPTITLDLSQIQGGIGRPTYEVTALVEQSLRPFYEPIPFDMSFINGDAPAVQVIVNKVQAQCKADCTYQTQPSLTPIILSFNENSKVVTIELSNVQQVQVEDLSIQYGGYECIPTNRNLSALACNVEGVEAGENVPVVLIKNQGYAQLNAASQTQSIIVDDISPTTGSVNGGQIITVNGQGFPKQLTNQLQVKFGNAHGLVKSSSHSQILVELPQSENQQTGNQPITISYNGQVLNNNIELAYSDVNVATIQSLEVQGIQTQNNEILKVSPVKKQQITIEGTNFFDAREDIEVWLLQQNQETNIWEQRYQVNVNIVNNTHIIATLSGGRVGDYQLRVFHKQYGYSIQSVQFKYIIEIQSISQTSGPKQGGQKLTITGLNFSPIEGNNQVFFEQQGGSIALLAEIESQNATVIEVRIPKMHEQGDIDEKWQITVFGRIIEQATCVDNVNSCEFTYLDNIQVPIIEGPGIAKVSNGDIIALEGENMPTQNDVAQAILLRDNKLVRTIPLALDSSTQLEQLTVPQDLEAGVYVAQIKLESNGVICQFYLMLQYQILGVLPDREWSMGGEDIVVKGSGFSQNSVVFVGGRECQIREIMYATEIKCTTSHESEEGEYSIFSHNSIIGSICRNCGKFSETQTPIIAQTIPSNLNSILPLSQQNFIYQLVENDFQNANILNAYLQSTFDLKFRIKAINISKNNQNYHQLEFDKDSIVGGTFEIIVQVEGKGFAKIHECQEQGCEGPAKYITFTLQDFQYVSGQNTGLAGGTELEIQGQGLNTDYEEMNKVLVCGHQCEIITGSVTSTNLRCKLPKINTKFIFQSGFQQEQQSLNLFQYFKAIFTSETSNQNVINTIQKKKVQKKNTVKGSKNVEKFWLEFHVQENAKLFIDTLKLNSQENFDLSNYYSKLKLQAKNSLQDQWQDLYTFTAQDVTSEFQEVQFQLQEQQNQSREEFILANSFKFFKVYEEQDQGELAFAELFVKSVSGQLFCQQDIEDNQDFSCKTQVFVNDQFSGIKYGEEVNYKGSLSSAIINDISPSFSTHQGSQIKIIGEGFGNNSTKLKVFVKGQQCTIDNIQDTQLQVTVPQQNPQQNSLDILVTLNNVPILKKKDVQFFPGALLWSHEDTWGGEAPPTKDNMIYIPKGQTLVIDQSSPKPLNSVIVEGTLLFDPDLELDLEFNFKYMIIREGKLQAGSENKPYRNKLTFNLYGNYWDKQLQDFGNKVIGCQNCQLDIHASKGLDSSNYAYLQETAQPGAQEIKLDRNVQNWQIGDYIAIGTTDFYGNHAEKVQITQIQQSQSGKTILQISPSLEFLHKSEQETFSGKSLQVRAEVALLSSNVKIQGSPDEYSTLQERYGGHLMVRGNKENTYAKIQGVEFNYMGQQRIVNRNTISFDSLGSINKYQSYIRNIKAHEVYARLISIYHTSYIKIQNNVGYKIPGHNIYLQDSAETHNIIEHNILISPQSAYNLFQTDISVAGIYLSHPSNHVRYNVISGSEFYGIQYEIKEENDSPTCPDGMPILSLEHNIAHSSQRFGLRIHSLQPRTYPCMKPRLDILRDPFMLNPSIQYTYHNQTAYKNGESGILAEQMGDSVFKDCILADNYRAGFQAQLTNFTSQPVVLKDSLIVGHSNINGEQITKIEQSAIIVPRTDGFYVENVQIHNMPKNSLVVQCSSENSNHKLWVQGGYQYHFNSIQIQNSTQSQTIQWLGPRANIIYDEDGTLSQKGQPTWITPYQPHFDRLIISGECERNEDLDDSVLCSVPIRSVKFSNLQKRTDFIGQQMRIFDLQDQTKQFDMNLSLDNDTVFGDMKTYRIKNNKADGDESYIALLPVNSVYNIHWNQGIDWDHVLVWPSVESQQDNDTIILRMLFQEQRELFEVFRMVAQENLESFYEQTDITKFFDPQTHIPNNSQKGCVNGDWIIDHDQQYFYLCINGKGRQEYKFQQIDITGVYCRDTCQVQGFTCDKQPGIKNFMETSQQKQNRQFLDENQGAIAMAKLPSEDEWQFRVPQKGDDVRIPCEWTMKFNIDSFTFNNLYIDGILRIEQRQSQKISIQAQNIWVRGKLVVGSEDQRFTQNLEIILTGGKDSDSLVIDDISRTGPKSLAVTGELELYGQELDIIHTKLARTAQQGDTEIQLIQETNDWKVGDYIALGANEYEGEGYEKAQIKAIDHINKLIELEYPLLHYHYGKQNPTISSQQNSEIKIDSNTYNDQNLDMRTPVGLLSRNIKILGEKENTNWGGHLQVYQYKFTDEKSGLEINQRGNVILQGVELENMGQRGSDNAGLHLLLTNQESEDEFKKSVLKNSSIHSCIGICFNAQNAQLFELSNNIIYSGRRFLIQASECKQVTIQNNLLIGVQERETADIKETKVWDPVALIHMYTTYRNEDQISVKNNIGSGSEGIGYAFPGTLCNEKQYNGFKNNQVGYCKYVGVIFNLEKKECYAVGHVQVHSSKAGVILNSLISDDVGYDAQNFIIAECQVNLKLHSASTSKIHNSFLKNSFISAIARPQCPDCYTQQKADSKQIYCNETVGIQLHVTTESGQNFPYEDHPLGYDAIKVAPSAFSSSFIENVEFYGYKHLYNAHDHPNFQQDVCFQNSALKNNQNAASATAGTYLRGVKCTECEKDGYILLTEPQQKWRGYYGGCGQFDCTGLGNILVQDMTGDFLGHQGSIVSNNEDITMSEGLNSICTYYQQWNAYDCVTLDLAILEWDAESDDKQKLNPSPVSIKNDIFENKVNMWREWSWDGSEPLQERYNRYVSLVLSDQVHNITYSSTKPASLVHKLQQRSVQGEQDRYIVVKYHYDSPLALEVKVDNNIILPWPLNNPQDLQQYNKTNCGANNYYFDNNTIHFVITNEPSCQVNVYQKNYLHVSLRLKMTPQEFYEGDTKISSFINVMAAFLNIQFSQIRIVGVKSYGQKRFLSDESGSQLTFIILDEVPKSQENGYQPKQDFLRLQSVAQTIQEGLQNEQISLGYEAEFDSAQPRVIKEVGKANENGQDPFLTEKDLIETPKNDGPTTPIGGGQPRNNPEQPMIRDKQKEEKDSLIAIALGITGGIFLSVIIAAVLYHYWKKKQFQAIRVENVSKNQSDIIMANEKQIVSGMFGYQDKSSRNYTIHQLNPSSISEYGNKSPDLSKREIIQSQNLQQQSQLDSESKSSGSKSSL